LSKPRKNRIREERIQNEAIVDAYGPEEQALGWYYYLENKTKFPFSARCIASKVVSPLRKGETVDVRRLAPEDSCAHDMLVLIRWHNRNVAVPLSQLVTIDADESTIEAIGDWHYWLAQGYCF
jgi:Calcium binding